MVVTELPTAVVGQFAVAELSERRNSLRVQDRRSATAANKNQIDPLTQLQETLVSEAARPGSLAQESSEGKLQSELDLPR